jgi:hypothetical protein
MNSIQTALPAIPPALPLELKGLLHENGQLFAVFTIGGIDRIVAAEVYEVLPFENFRRLILEQFDLRVIYRRGRWFSDVVEAAARGGIKIEVDDLAKAIWLNSKSITFAEAGSIADVSLSPMVRFEAERLGVAG